jgi:hypothetical protein
MKKIQLLQVWSTFLVVLILAGCSTNGNTLQLGDSENTSTISSEIEKVEIIHFHGTSQCYSCKTVGAYAEETVNTYFADEVKSGKITFAHINAELPENRELAVKYGVTSASLWLGTYWKDGQFKAVQNVEVWYKISNKEEYLSYLKGIIEQKLAGN